MGEEEDTSDKMSDSIKDDMASKMGLLDPKAQEALNDLLDNELKDMIDDETMITDDMNIDAEKALESAEAMIDKINNNPDLSDKEKEKLSKLVADAVKDAEALM